MKLRLAILLASAVTSVAGPSWAWTVGSSVTRPCHEMLSVGDYVEPWTSFVPADFTPPTSNTWEKVLDHLLENLPLDVTSFTTEQRFMLLSLLVGIQAPDTGGHALLNIENLHNLVGNPDPEAQYQHALRAPRDDYEEGNVTAIAGTRQAVLHELQLAQQYLNVPTDQQTIEVPFYLDFYGQLTLPVYAPMFYLGEALHTFQDSFSHNLRDEHDGYRSIVHVMNFIEAIDTGFDEQRDGLPHSAGMDQCERPELVGLVQTTTAASRELLEAGGADLQSGKTTHVTAVLDEWMRLKPGCTLENEFCDNGDLLRVARDDPAKPLIQQAAGCSISERGTTGGTPVGLVWAATLLAAGLLGRTRQRR